MAEAKRPRRVWQPDPPKKGSRPPTPLGALVDPARAVFAQKAGIVIDRERWRRAVGDRIAERAEPGWLKGPVLTVITASAAWAQELSLLAPDIIRKLAEHGLVVQGLRFVVRDGAGYRPGIARLTRATREALPIELRERLKNVDDPELAAAIAEAAGFSLSTRKPNAQQRARGPRAAGARTAPSGRNSRRGPAGS